jgi:hypothetical protein
VQVCLERAVPPPSSSSARGFPVPEAQAGEEKDREDRDRGRLEVSRTAVTAAVLLSAMLRRLAPAASTATISTSPDDCSHPAQATGGEGGEGRSEGAEAYVEKHFPWLLVLADRRLLHALQGRLEEEVL